MIVATATSTLQNPNHAGTYSRHDQRVMNINNIALVLAMLNTERFVH